MKKLILLALVFIALSSCKERRYNPDEEGKINKSDYIAYGVHEEGEIEVVEVKTIGRIGTVAIIDVNGERFLVHQDGFIQPLKKSYE